MITYELALALKNAGFEQSLDSFQGYYMDDSDDIGTHQVYIPTLSELIEVCGDKFGALTQYDREKGEGWFASGHKIIWDSNENGYICVNGLTPEIAVANLYLVINSKK